MSATKVDMNSIHLCKAKTITDRTWVQGYYVYDYGKDIHYIFANEIACPNCINDRRKDFSLQDYEIDPSTLCHCTGMRDKNSKLIWENDIVHFLGHEGTIKFECGSFGIEYQENIDWEEIQINIMRVTKCANVLYACENDNYISLWEIYWNFNDEDDLVNTVEVIGNKFDTIKE